VSTPGAGRTGQLGRIGRLVRKELNEILRDRRTIITLVLMPLLLYPLLFVAFQQFLLATRQADQVPVYRLGFRSDDDGDQVRRYLFWDATPQGDKPAGFRPTLADPRRMGSQPFLKLLGPEQPEEGEKPGYLRRLLRDCEIDLGVRVRQPLSTLGATTVGLGACPLATSPLSTSAVLVAGIGLDRALDLDLIYLPDSPVSVEALRWVERQCDLANFKHLQSRLGELHVSQRAEPVETVRVPAQEREPNRGDFLAALVPLILILMTITGAVYPAIDLTAGERERGTLEVLVAAPVPRLGLLFAKYVTVLTVAVLTALVNLVMMTLTLVVTRMGTQFVGLSTLSAVTVLEVFGLLLLFAAFFSAVLLTLTSFARSFKEAQAYLIPLMLVSLAPGLIGMLPGLSLSGPLAIVPLLNIVLLARDMLDPARSVDPAAAATVVVSTLLYALAALSLAAHIFGAEGVLYSEQGNWSDLFRRPAQPRRVATIAGALACVALMFPTAFVLVYLVGVWLDVPPTVGVGVQAGTAIVLFGVFPLMASALGRVRLSSGLRLHRAPWPTYLGAIVLGLSLWPFAIRLLQAMRGPGSLVWGPEHEQMIEGLVAQWRGLSPVWTVLALAVVPAFFEELFFRGYLFSALRARNGPATTILVSAVLFGLFHSFVLFGQAVTSTLLGLVLGWVAWTSRSVIPGMVIHACHNGLVLLALHYHEEIGRLGWFGPNAADLPAEWLAGAAVAAGVGALLVWLAPRKAEPVGQMEAEQVDAAV
jgi:ABC-2 type transport system permease protein/sodium transport system permease protein